MRPAGIRPGALAGSALARNRLISQTMPSAGVLRDQQTLGERTGTHGHLLLSGLMNAGNAYDDTTPPKGRRCLHITAFLTLEL